MFVGAGSARAVVVFMVVALSVAGCGSENGSDAGGAKPHVAANGAERQITVAYAGFFDAIESGRWSDACEVYSAAYVRSAPKQLGMADDCPGTLKAEYSVLRELRRPRVVGVRVTGPRAGVLLVKSRRGGNTTPLAVVREKGEWKLDGLDESANRYGTANVPRQYQGD